MDVTTETLAERKTRFALRKFTNPDAMKAEEYAYWQSRPDHERMAAVSELSLELYRLKDPTINVSDFQRTLVRLKFPQG